MCFKVLIDNNLNPTNQYWSEHGLSVYFEFSGQKFLIDTGQSDSFIFNAKKLGINIKDIDILFISHGHFDHIGGLEGFLLFNSKARIVVSANVLNHSYFSCRHVVKKDVGKDLSFINSYRNRVVFIQNDLEIIPGLFVISNILQVYPTPKANRTLFKFNGKQEDLDDFNHEIIICTYDKGRLNVYTGCGHKGILNILSTVENKFKNVPISNVVGGYHLLESDANNKFETEEDISQIGEFLQNQYPETIFHTGHCTSNQAINILKSKLNSRIKTFYSGFEFEN